MSYGYRLRSEPQRSQKQKTYIRAPLVVVSGMSQMFDWVRLHPALFRFTAISRRLRSFRNTQVI